MKWSSTARNHLKKVQKNIENGTIRIIESMSLEEFTDAYEKSHIKDPNKRVHLQWCKRMIVTQGMLNKRIYLGYL